ncbi:hypothetical protein, partial [Yoonia sp. R2-816]|uniref:hypothetical protein n=1 Tax=Yoonia sp. R2-816 TaxID=3342638 RepID=UPI00372A9330
PSSINRAKRSRNSIGNGAGMINPPKKGEPQIMSQGNPADSNFYRNALMVWKRSMNTDVDRI